MTAKSQPRKNSNTGKVHGIGKAVRNVRKELSLTQESFAQEVNVSRETQVAIENMHGVTIAALRLGYFKNIRNLISQKGGVSEGSELLLKAEMMKHAGY